MGVVRWGDGSPSMRPCHRHPVHRHPCRRHPCRRYGTAASRDEKAVAAREGAVTRACDRFKMFLPPPNVTGALHLGHALTGSIQVERRQ